MPALPRTSTACIKQWKSQRNGDVKLQTAAELSICSAGLKIKACVEQSHTLGSVFAPTTDKFLGLTMSVKC
jgi:hypothetical protein